MHVGKAAGRDLIKCAVNVGGPGTTVDIDRRIFFLLLDYMVFLFLKFLVFFVRHFVL